jgi:hypothetical protein
VEAKPRRGFFVRAFDRQEMISIFELREVLEGLAARRAALAVCDGQIDQLRKCFSKFSAIDPITNYREYAAKTVDFTTSLRKSLPGSFWKASFPHTTSSAFPTSWSRPKDWCALPMKRWANI